MISRDSELLKTAIPFLDDIRNNWARLKLVGETHYKEDMLSLIHI